MSLSQNEHPMFNEIQCIEFHTKRQIISRLFLILIELKLSEVMIN